MSILSRFIKAAEGANTNKMWWQFPGTPTETEHQKAANEVSRAKKRNRNGQTWYENQEQARRNMRISKAGGWVPGRFFAKTLETR